MRKSNTLAYGIKAMVTMAWWTGQRMRGRANSLTTVSLARLARDIDDAGIRLRVPGPVSGEFRFRAEQDGNSVDLLTARDVDKDTFLPLPLDQLFPGQSSLVMEYVDGGTLLFAERLPINAGRVNIAIDPSLTVGTGVNGLPELRGKLWVSADGALPPFNVNIRYELRSPGIAAPLHDQWHVRYGGLDLPVESASTEAQPISFNIPLQLSASEAANREIFVTVHPTLKSSLSLELAKTGRNQLVFGERRAAFPPIGDYQVLRGDFHIHTTLSDGELDPIDRTWESYMYGYDVIALTDHRWTTSGYDLSIDLANDIGLLMIRGFETGIDEREHFIVLDIDPSYVLRDEHHWALKPGTDRLFYQDKVRDIIKHGGFIHYAHPGSIYIAPPTYRHPDREHGWTEEVAWMIDQGYLHGIEVKANYTPARRDAAFRWALEYGLTLVETSDIHKPRDFANQAASPATLVLTRENSADGVMEALREGRTLIWRGGQLRGTETWLAPFMDAILSFEPVTENGRACLKVTNNSGLPLHGLAEVGTGGKQRIQLLAYSTTCLNVSGEAPSVSVLWTNIWSSPNSLLETVHHVD